MGAPSTAEKVDLFLLRNRILVAERAVSRFEERVAKWTETPFPNIPQLLSEAQANLKAAQEHLSTLRSALADAVQGVL